VNCGTRDAKGFGPVATVTFSTRSNSLVSKGFYYCNGSFTADYIIGVEDWLTDAKGHRTAPVRNFWVCKTH